MYRLQLHRSSGVVARRGRPATTTTAPQYSQSLKRSNRHRRELTRHDRLLRRLSWIAASESGFSLPLSNEDRNQTGTFWNSVFENGIERQLGDELSERVQALPGTQDYTDYIMRASSLVKWKHCLQKGTLPHEKDVVWPEEPFRKKFAESLRNMEMLNFTRRYPKLTKSLLRRMLELAHAYEEALLEMENNNPSKQESDRSKTTSNGAPGALEQQQDSLGGGQTEPTDSTAEANGNMVPGGEGNGQGQEIEMDLQSSNVSQNGKNNDNDNEQAAMQAEMERIAEELVESFEEEIGPIAENLKKASNAFQYLDDLIDEEKGFGLESGVWKRSGWQEVENLRRKLEDLKELRDLVRNLGRSGGRGPKRKAPAQIYRSGYPPGVIRSSLQPEETSGLCRSGELGLMLPSEAALMAAGWPKDRNVEELDDDKHKRVSRAARLLHLARRAERNLLSYERTGWLEDEPSRVLPHLEYRPAAEQGPIIVCLDTSGSMQGTPETVAKALVLECIRGAHKQERNCYLYAFSSYKDIKELDLSTGAHALPTMLDFLEHSFLGGTDVTRALELSIERVKNKEWAQADILIVTDGEMRLPRQQLLDDMETIKNDRNLEVHGLLIGRSYSQAMKSICSHLHIFQSWDAARSTKRDR